MKKILAFLVMALLAMPLAASAWTPDGDVTVIVAYKAGSGTDTVSRFASRVRIRDYAYEDAESYPNLPETIPMQMQFVDRSSKARRPHHRLHQPAHLHHPGRAARLHLRRQRRGARLQPAERDRRGGRACQQPLEEPQGTGGCL
mgnify:CR=1 FL=1